MSEDILQKYVKQIVEQAGLGGLPESFQRDYMEKLSVEAQRRLGIMALAEIDEQGLKEFDKLTSGAKQPTTKELLDFLNAHIPDFEKKAAVALQKFAEEFIAGAERLRANNS